jgi:hypothetical protein
MNLALASEDEVNMHRIGLALTLLAILVLVVACQYPLRPMP